MRALAMLAVIGCGRIGFVEQSVHSTLSLDRKDPGEVLADFPLLVVLDDVRADRRLFMSDASDVRFLDSSGNVLAHELEQVGEIGGAPLVAWVRVPTITGTSTQIVVRYGVGAPPASSDSAWSSEYEAVWHLADADSSGASDATGNHPGTANGTDTAPGLIANGRSFSSNQLSVIVVPDAPSLGFNAITASGWMYLRTAPIAYAALVDRELDAGAANDIYLGDKLGQIFYTVRAGASNTGVTTGSLGPGQWHHIAMTVDAARFAAYFDGVPLKSGPTAGALAHSPNPVMLGACRNNIDGTNRTTIPDTDFIDGVLDEVRLENVVRSPAWIAYDVLAMQDGAITYGAIEY
jgi:hypothetical protein